MKAKKTIKEHEFEDDTDFFGAVGTIPKGLIKGLEVLEISGRVEIIKTTNLLSLDRILRRVVEI